MSDLERRFAAARARQCTSKKRYDSQAEAERAALAAAHPYARDESYSAYKCSWCSGWHVGRSKPKP